MKFYSGLVIIAVMLSSGCAASMDSKSDIPGQLNDGGWVLNIPGAPHTHRVRLAACPESPLVTTHTHDHDQVGRAPHKHNGCFTCPAQGSLASRLYDKK
uniref:Uncharacterized protein n=1 Tax=uncultured Thiotrichaceae bacterium TaxID=298394 RepID=A0A6S6U2L2_9GAMM|nr:MAG: Unknown protein [uncultured Thiotrichaceae bacterium]